MIPIVAVSCFSYFEALHHSAGLWIWLEDASRQRFQKQYRPHRAGAISMSAPDPVLSPGAIAVFGEGGRSDEGSPHVLWKIAPPARQQVFSAALVISAIGIFEKRLGRPVSDGEARMLLARLVDFVRLGVDGSEGTPVDTRTHHPAQPYGQKWSGENKPEGR